MVALTFEYLVWEPSKAASSGREIKNKFGSTSNSSVGQLEVVTSARSEDPAAAFSLHREGDECQLPTL